MFLCEYIIDHFQLFTFSVVLVSGRDQFKQLNTSFSHLETQHPLQIQLRSVYAFLMRILRAAANYFHHPVICQLILHSWPVKCPQIVMNHNALCILQGAGFSQATGSFSPSQHLSDPYQHFFCHIC